MESNEILASDYHVRCMDEKDILILYDLTIHELGYAALHKEAFIENLRVIANHSDYETYVILKDDMVIGYAGIVCGYAYNYIGKTFQIIAFVIQEMYQHKGAGRALLNHIQQIAKKETVDVIVVNSGVQRIHAHSFYEKLGFKRTGYAFKYECFDE